MQKPALVIMAAGMGSRFGGLKQIQPVDDEGHAIIDFSLFDARRAGFEKHMKDRAGHERGPHGKKPGKDGPPPDAPK